VENSASERMDYIDGRVSIPGDENQEKRKPI
jgi:hypothetical protein